MRPPPIEAIRFSLSGVNVFAVQDIKMVNNSPKTENGSIVPSKIKRCSKSVMVMVRSRNAAEINNSMRNDEKKILSGRGCNVKCRKDG